MRFVSAFLAATAFVSGAAMAQPDGQSRPGYARTVEKALLEMGNSADVAMTEGGSTLFVFGHFDKAYVYLLITRARLLDDAHASGFQKVDLFDRGSNGRWIFDLKKGPPSCDIRRRVCR